MYNLVGEAAAKLGISDYGIFKLAAIEWGYSLSIDKQFTKYMKFEEIPFWVRDYCRKILNDRTREDTLLT